MAAPAKNPASDHCSPGLLDEDALVDRYHRCGDRRARALLIERLMPLVRSIARRYEHRGEPLEDLVQAGSLGLVKAVDRFDPDRGVMLSSFAVPNVAGEIKRYFRDSTRTIRVPRDIQERKSDLATAMDGLVAALGRFPTVDELADETDSSPEEVVEALQSAHAYHPQSLDEPLGDDDEMGSLIGDADEHFEQAEARVLLESELEQLSHRDVEILRLRYAEDLTQSEIAARVGVSQMQVSRLLRRAIDRLYEQVTGGRAQMSGSGGT